VFETGLIDGFEEARAQGCVDLDGGVYDDPGDSVEVGVVQCGTPF
jgi:hypothetical protein